MPTAAIYQDLVPIDLPLAAIYLDPNNPRFVGPTWQQIEDHDIDLEKEQETAQRLLVRDYGVEKLRMNMEVNGYLPIDRVVVRKFKEGKYVVLEGNRRIAAAKMISPIASDGTTVSEEVLKSLVTIPCLEYTGTEHDAAWIFQGLRHITGITEWSAYNKARLLVEQMEEEGINLTEAGRRFGLTPFGAGQWVRGYYAFKQAREESDYIKEVDERSYPYFQELFSKSSIAVREWMDWNEDEKKFKDALHFNEFIGWLYPRNPDDEKSEGEGPGDWDRRRLSRRDDIRSVAFLLTNAEKYFEQFRAGMELESAYALATAEAVQQKTAESADRVKDVFDIVATCSKALENLPIKIVKDEALKKEFSEKLSFLEKMVKETQAFVS